MGKKRKSNSNQSNSAPPEASQIAEVGWLSQSFADHPSRGLTPQRLHQILIAAEQGDLAAQSDLFNDMEERDTHLFSELSKRKRANLSLAYQIEPPPNPTPEEKKQAIELVEWLGELDDTEQMTLDALDAIGHGFSAQELSWSRYGNLWLINGMEYQPQRLFQTPIGQPNVLRLRDGSINGAEPWEMGWFIHRHKAKSGYISRSGLHRILVWPYLFKNYATRDLAEFLEIYGLPMRIGKYPPGSTEQEKRTLLRAVTVLGHNAAGIIPQGMAIEFQNAASGQSDPFEYMIKWAEMSISKAILGGTLTSQADGKSSTNALGKVHEEAFNRIVESDAKQFARSFNQQVIGALMQLNRPEVDPRRYPRLVYDFTETADLQSFSESLERFVRLGFKVGREWAQKRAGIPTPGDQEETLTLNPGPASAVVAAPNQLSIAANTQINDTVSSIEQKASDYSQALDHAYQQQVTPEKLNEIAGTLLQPILAALSRANDYDTALGLLADLYPGKEISQLQDNLSHILFAAEASGHLAALEGRDLTSEDAALNGQD